MVNSNSPEPKNLGDLVATAVQAHGVLAQAEKHVCTATREYRTAMVRIRHEIEKGNTTGDPLTDFLYARAELYHHERMGRGLRILNDEITAHVGQQVLSVRIYPPSMDERTEDISYTLGFIEGGLQFESSEMNIYFPISLMTNKREGRVVKPWERIPSERARLTNNLAYKFGLDTEDFWKAADASSRNDDGTSWRDPMYGNEGICERKHYLFIGDQDVKAFFYLGLEKLQEALPLIKAPQVGPLLDIVMGQEIHDPSYACALELLGREVPPVLKEMYERTMKETSGRRLRLAG